MNNILVDCEPPSSIQWHKLLWQISHRCIFILKSSRVNKYSDGTMCLRINCFDFEFVTYSNGQTIFSSQLQVNERERKGGSSVYGIEYIVLICICCDSKIRKLSHYLEYFFGCGSTMQNAEWDIGIFAHTLCALVFSV